MSGVVDVEMGREPLSDDELAVAWDALADRAGVSPFLRPGWFRAWSGELVSARVDVLTARVGGELVGVLPVIRRPGMRRSPTNWESFEFGPVAADDGARGALLSALVGRRLGVTSLRYLRSSDVAALERVTAARGVVVSRVHQRSPYIPIVQDWETYTTRFDRRWLRQLESRRRRLDQRGGLTLEVVDGGRGLDEHLEEGFALEAMGWKGDAGTAILSSPRTTRFYRRVSAWAAERGWLRLAFLRVGGRAVAFDLCFEGAGVHWFLKTGFDPAWREQAPGLLLRHDMVRRSFDLGLRTYELMGGEEPWKRRWTDDHRDAVHAVVLPGRRTGPVAAWAWRRALPVAQRARVRARGGLGGRVAG